MQTHRQTVVAAVPPTNDVSPAQIRSYSPRIGANAAQKRRMVAPVSSQNITPGAILHSMVNCRHSRENMRVMEPPLSYERAVCKGSAMHRSPCA